MKKKLKLALSRETLRRLESMQGVAAGAPPTVTRTYCDTDASCDTCAGVYTCWGASCSIVHCAPSCTC